MRIKRGRGLSYTIVALLVTLALAFPASGSAAEPVSVNIASLDSSQFPALTAVVDVLDASGRPVVGLTPNSFQATVGGQPAPVVGLQTAVDADVSLAVVLAVDVSGSMNGEPLTQARKAAGDFVQSLSPQDTVAVLTFGDSVILAQDFTSDKGAVTAALDSLQAVGNTALYQGAGEAVSRAGASPLPRKVIILLSDGIDYGGKSTISRDDSIAQARLVGVPVYTVGLGSEIDRDYLLVLSQSTGARFLETPTAEGLSQLYADIGNLLRGQYVVKLSSPMMDRSQPLSLALSVTVSGATATATETVPALALGAVPRVSLSGLNEGQKIDSAVTLDAEVTADSAVKSVRFLIDGESVSEDTTPPFQLSLDPAAFALGTHTLRVEVEDSTGAVGQTETSFLVVTPPAAGSGGGELPLPAARLLLAPLLVVLGGAGAYLLWRRRSRLAPNRSAEVRLRPWFNSACNSPAISPEDWADPVVPEMSSPTVGEICGKLRIVSGPGAGQEFGVGSRPITIGSGGWCTIVLPDDEGRVGAEEARAWMHQTNRLIFHKLTRLSVLAAEGSPGGWLVLQDGDEISVGPCRLAFQLVTVQSEADESVGSAINEALRGFSAGPESGVASGATVESREQPVDHGNQVPPWERQPADGASQVRSPEQAVDSVSPARTWEQPADGVISIRSADQDNEDAEDIDEAAG